MKKKILEALKAKFEGVNASILDRVAVSMAKKIKTEDEVETAVDGVTIDSLYELYAEIRATESAATSIANYEKKYNLKNGKAVKAPDHDDDDDDDTKDGDDDDKNPMKALLAELKALRTEVNTMKSGETAKSRRARLDEVLKDLTPAQKKAYARMSVDGGTDEEFETTLTEIKDEVEALKSETQKRGSVFSAPFTGSGKGGDEKASDDEIKAVVDIL